MKMASSGKVLLGDWKETNFHFHSSSENLTICCRVLLIVRKLLRKEQKKHFFGEKVQKIVLRAGQVPGRTASQNWKR